MAKEKKWDKMKVFIIFFVSLAALMSCSGKIDSNGISCEFGDSIATIDCTTYYWKQLAIDSARISAIKDSKVITECIVKGPVYGAKQFEDGEIYILCDQNQVFGFDIKNIPSELEMLTEEDIENYDLSQENADAVINE